MLRVQYIYIQRLSSGILYVSYVYAKVMLYTYYYMLNCLSGSSVAACKSALSLQTWRAKQEQNGGPKKWRIQPIEKCLSYSKDRTGGVAQDPCVYVCPDRLLDANLSCPLHSIQTWWPKKWRKLSRVLQGLWRSNHPTGGLDMWLFVRIGSFLQTCLVPFTQCKHWCRKNGGNFHAFYMAIESSYRVAQASIC